jgi:transcriptional regulator of aromatic amino acid metabolism
MPRKPSQARQLQRLLDAAATPVYLLDSQRRLIFGNAAFSAWIGRRAEEVAGLKLVYSTGAEASGAGELACALCPPPEAFTGEIAEGTVAAPASGEQVLHTARFAPLRDPDGEPAGLCVFVGPVLAEAKTAEEGAALHQQLLALRRELGRRFHIGQIIGVSPQMAKVRRQVKLAAQSRANVVIIGPPGSGRQHVARTIHYAPQGAGATVGPLVPVDCSLLDAELMQSAVTSVLKRREEAPTDRPAALLLVDADRLGEAAQQELAGFVRLPGVEIMLLATASVPLARLVRQGRFREDLACTLSTLSIALPPLARRPVDVPLLAQYFLEAANAEGGKQLSGFQTEAMDRLVAFDWPGNVAQLAQVVRQAHACAAGPKVQVGDLPPLLHHAAQAQARRGRDSQPVRLDEFLTEVETELLRRALALAGGNKSRAAQLLGIHRARLIRRLAQLGLARPAAVEPIPFEEVQESDDRP